MPTFTICTTAFEQLAELVGSALSDRKLARGVMEHPFGGIGEPAVQERVEALWPALSAWIEGLR